MTNAKLADELSPTDAASAVSTSPPASANAAQPAKPPLAKPPRREKRTPPPAPPIAKSPPEKNAAAIARSKKNSEANSNDCADETSSASSDSPAALPGAPRGRRLPRLLRSTPSWLVSSIVHLIAIIALALSTIVSHEPFRSSVLVGEISEDAEPLVLDVVEFAPQVQMTNEVAAVAPATETLGFSDVGDLADAASNSAAENIGDLELSPVGDIGDIFGSKGQGMASATAGTKGAEFFGVKAAGRKFVFIVDSSNSMKNGKFDDAKQELLYAIQRLTKDQFFYIIFFDQNAERLRLFPNTEPEDNAVRATIENIKRAEKWVHTVENELKTNPFEAVKYAMEMLPDAIYLLSDGKFTDKGRTVQYLKANNIINDPIDGRRPKVVFHTVGFYSRDGEETLESIAKAYGGTYRFVPEPKKK